MSLVLLPTELLVEVMQRLDSATELANFTRSAQFAAIMRGKEGKVYHWQQE